MQFLNNCIKIVVLLKVVCCKILFVLFMVKWVASKFQTWLYQYFSFKVACFKVSYK